MKIIATIVTSLLLSLGLLVAPASAEEPSPEPTCEETVQEWRERAVAAEAEIERLQVVHANELRAQSQLASWYAGAYKILQENLDQANRSVYRMVRIAERRRTKIAEMRETIRELRRQSR